MATKADVLAWSEAATETERRLALDLVAVARWLAVNVRNYYPRLTLEQRLSQEHIAAVIATSADDQELKQLHTLMHLVHGLARRLRPPASDLERWPAAPPEEKMTGKPDIIIVENLDEETAG